MHYLIKHTLKAFDIQNFQQTWIIWSSLYGQRVPIECGSVKIQCFVEVVSISQMDKHSGFPEYEDNRFEKDHKISN